MLSLSSAFVSCARFFTHDAALRKPSCEILTSVATSKLAWSMRSSFLCFELRQWRVGKNIHMVFYLRKKMTERTTSIRKKKWINDGSAGLLMSDCQATHNPKTVALFVCFCDDVLSYVAPAPAFSSRRPETHAKTSSPREQQWCWSLCACPCLLHRNNFVDWKPESRRIIVPELGPSQFPRGRAYFSSCTCFMCTERICA